MFILGWTSLRGKNCFTHKNTPRAAETEVEDLMKWGSVFSGGGGTLGLLVPVPGGGGQEKSGRWEEYSR